MGYIVRLACPPIRDPLGDVNHIHPGYGLLSPYFAPQSHISSSWWKSKVPTLHTAKSVAKWCGTRQCFKENTTQARYQNGYCFGNIKHALGGIQEPAVTYLAACET